MSEKFPELLKRGESIIIIIMIMIMTITIIIVSVIIIGRKKSDNHNNRCLDNTKN